MNGENPLVTFVREAARHPRTVGAVAPSGRRLAYALTDPVRSGSPRPLSVLEVGAGTGAVTRILLKSLARGSHLDVVEANAPFVARLNGMLTASETLSSRGATAEVHHEFVENFAVGRRYDVIVSGLPMTNFTPEKVDEIMNRLLWLMHPSAVLTYFAYVGTRAARRVFASSAEARRHASVNEVMNGFQQIYGTGRRTIWPNVPPAHVWQLRSPQAARKAPGRCRSLPSGLGRP